MGRVNKSLQKSTQKNMFDLFLTVFLFTVRRRVEGEEVVMSKKGIFSWKCLPYDILLLDATSSEPVK